MSRNLMGLELLLQNRIEQVEVIPFNLREVAPRTLAYGSLSVRRNVLVRLTASKGSTGVGETEPIPAREGCEETQGTVVEVLSSELPGLLIGQDPRNIDQVVRAFSRRIGSAPYARAALVDALYDLVANELKVPLWALLGGKLHGRFRASWSISFRDDETAAAEEAVQATESGYTWLKVKIGRGADVDVPTVAAIREAVGPSVRIHVDANASLQYAEALPLLRQIERFDIALAEQPLAARHLRGSARLRAATNIPIMLDESVRSADDMLEAVRLEAADAVLLKLAKHGGIRETRLIGEIAHRAGLMIYPGTHRSSSVGAAAAAHAYAGMANLTPGDFAVGPTRLKDDIVRSRFHVHEGVVDLPDGVGIGVEVDPGLLEDARNRAEGDD